MEQMKFKTNWNKKLYNNMKAEFVPFVRVSITRYTKGKRFFLQTVRSFEMPRNYYDNRGFHWIDIIFRFASAKFWKDKVELSFCYFDKYEDKTDFDEVATKLQYAKGILTRYENKLEAWRINFKPTFFETAEQTEQYKKAVEKIENKRNEVFLLQKKLNEINKN